MINFMIYKSKYTCIFKNHVPPMYDYCMSDNQTDEGKKVKKMLNPKKLELVTLMNISYFGNPNTIGMP